MRLDALTLEQCEQVRLWRNDALYALRTPYPLTAEQQAEFYRNVVCDRNARSRYWAVILADSFVGQAGLENIEWENRRAEISLLIDTQYRGKGIGEQAFELLMEQGFKYMNLDHIWGECYLSNPAIKFWTRLAEKHNAKTVVIPATRFWEGNTVASYHFTFSRRGWK